MFNYQIKKSVLKKYIILQIILFVFLGCKQQSFNQKNLLSNNRSVSEWTELDFKNPSKSAKTQVWYHWLNGNIDTTFVTKDLESMKEIGIGGFHLFNVAEGTPAGKVIFHSPLWWDAVIHTKKEAKRLDLEMGIMNTPGWSTSGGPWITPEKAMQEVVWTEKQFEGPLKFSGKLSIPKPGLGIERDMKRDTIVNQRYYMPRDHVKGYYNDIALLAFPTPQGEINSKPYRIKQWWNKAGYRKNKNGLTRDNRIAPESEIVKTESIINITDKLDSEGNLIWDIPQGNWTILRIGYQPTGRSNHPAPKGGKGLEVDRMSSEAVEIHWNEAVLKMLKAGGKDLKDVITSVTIDSYEAGHQNWTKGFEDKFKSQVGYDIINYLPAITGRVISSIDTTEDFLWDFRNTISNLITLNYYATFQKLAHKNGVSFAAEGYGNFGNTDDLSVAKYIDIPANEFWANKSNHHGGITKLSSSTAHIYGKKIVGAEAFTGSPLKIFETNPKDIKSQGDWFYAKGINQFWLHTFTHNPFYQKPGLLLGTYGSQFNRHNTWWKFAKGWFDYQAKTQYMLQQGNPKNDILYYVQEHEPVSPKLKEGLTPSIPSGYDYDFCNLDILKKTKIIDGKLLLPNGLEYSVLVFHNKKIVNIETLKVLKELISEGATVLANKPQKILGINNSKNYEEEFKTILSEVWGNQKVNKGYKKKIGKGLIYSEESILNVVKDINLLPDFEFVLDNKIEYGETLFPGNGIEFIHRNTENTDVYFVSNQHDKAKTIKAKFRVGDRIPELWNSDTGEITKSQEYKKTEDGRIEVTLRLEESGSIFVVFRNKLTQNAVNTYKKPVIEKQITFNKPWKVSFEGIAAPEEIKMQELIDISKHTNPKVASFSGTITYQNNINIEVLDTTKNFILNLGKVEVAAAVYVNEKLVGNLWKNPFNINIASYLKKGENKIQIDVANLWVNRLIADQKLPENGDYSSKNASTARGFGLQKIPDWVTQGKESPTSRKTFVGWKWDHLEDKELIPSGLIGPVFLYIEN